MMTIRECICPHCGYEKWDWDECSCNTYFDLDEIHMTYKIKCEKCDKEYLYVQDFVVIESYTEKV